MNAFDFWGKQITKILEYLDKHRFQARLIVILFMCLIFIEVILTFLE